MARLRGPAPDSWSFLLVGGAFKSAGGLTGVAYAGLTGSTLADIRVDDGTDTPGATIPGSAVTIDSATSAPPQFWFPDGDVSVVYMSVNGGPRTPVYALYDPRINAKVGKGEQLISVADYGATGNGTTDDTAAINAALAAAPAGSTVLFPQPPAHYLITDALAVRTAGLTIRGAGRGVEIRQTTWLKPALDILDADDITVESLYLNYTGATRTMGAGSFRGSNPYVFSAGVWTNSNRTTIQHCRIKRFTCGVFLSPWDTTSSTFVHGVTGNKVLNCEVDNVDFGILYLGQIGLEIGSVYGHDFLDASGGANPTHLIYGSGSNITTMPSSNDANIHDLLCVNNPTGAAFQTKYTNGGTMTGLTAESCGGLLNVVDIADIVMSGLVGRNMTPAAGQAAITLGYTGNNLRSSLSNMHLTMSNGGRALTLLGDDMRYSNINVVSARDGTNIDTEYCVHLRGSRNVVDGLTLTETGTASRPLVIGFPAYTTADNTIRNLALRGTKGLADVHTAATGTVISYAPAAQRNITGTNYVAANGGAATWTLSRHEYTRATILSGGTTTLTPVPALETVSLADVQTSSAITIAAPAGTAQKGMTQTIAVANNSGGGLGVITWNAAYLLADAFVAPASGVTYQVTFSYDGTSWREVSRTAGAATPVTSTQTYFSTYGESPGATMQVSGATAVVSANGGLVVRVTPRRDMTIAVLTWISATQSGNYDIGILDSSGGRLWSKGATAWPAPATVNETVSPAVTLTAGDSYYVVFSADNTTGTFRGNSSTADLGRLLDGTYVTRSGTGLYPVPATVTLGSLSAVGRIPVVILREA